MQLLIIIIAVSFFVLFIVFQFTSEDKKLKTARNNILKKEQPENPGQAHKYEQVVELLEEKKFTGKERKIYARACFLLFNYYNSKSGTRKDFLKGIKFGEKIKSNCEGFSFYENVVFSLGNIYFFNLFEFPKARNTYTRLIKIKPETKWGKICKIRINLIEENESNTKALRLYVTAEKLFENSKFKEATEYLNKVIKQFGNIKLIAHAYYFVGDIYYYKMQDLNRAEANYIEACKQSSIREIARNSLYKIGEIKRKKKKWEKAIKIYKKFIGQFPNSPGVEDAYYYIGESYLKLGKLKAAKNSFNLILGDFPDSKWTDVIYHKVQNINKELYNYA